MFRKVDNRLWFRLVWGLGMLVVVIPSWASHRSTLWLVVSIVYGVLMVVYVAVTLTEIWRRARSDDPVPPPLPARPMSTDWVSPQSVGLLVAVFITVLVIGHFAYG